MLIKVPPERLWMLFFSYGCNGQLLCLHQKPAYGIVRDEAEWHSLFIVIVYQVQIVLTDTYNNANLFEMDVLYRE